MNQNYSSKKDKILSILNNLKDITEKLNIKVVNENIIELFDKLRDDSFYLVVMGQFKRGKSTFINYILGENVLPTSAIPLTSIITKVYYLSSPSVNVTFNNGKKNSIELKELYEYCTEQGNPENIKDVKEVEIGYPFDFVNKDIILIDTPGIGSIYKHNTDVSFDFIPKADAVFFMLSVDPPISNVERTFLAQIKNHVDKIFFVLNKIDYSDTKTVDEISNYTKQVLSETLSIKDVALYPISAKLALEGKTSGNKEIMEKSNINLLESRITQFLLNEKGSTLISNSYKSIDKTLALIENYIRSSIELKKLPVDQLKDKVTKFEDFLESFESSKKEVSYLFNGEIKEILGKVDQMIEECKKTITNDITENIRKRQIDIRKLNRLSQEKELDEYLEKLIIENFDNWKLQVQDIVETKYSKTLVKYNNKVNEIITSIKDAVIDLFHMDLEYFKGSKMITAESRFRYKIGAHYSFTLLDFNPTYFTFVMPKSMAEKLILKRILAKVDIYIDRTCGGIRYDILRRMQESWSEFEYELSKKADNMINTVKTLVSDASKEYSKNLTHYNAEHEQYNSILDTVAELKHQSAH